MIGSAIESILSGVTKYVEGGKLPDRLRDQWVNYTMISNRPNNTKDGASTYDGYRFQLDIYSRTYKEMDTLAESVKSTLNEYTGTSESVVIDHIFFDGEWSTVEYFDVGVTGSFSASGDKAVQAYYRRSQDYIIYVRP